MKQSHLVALCLALTALVLAYIGHPLSFGPEPHVAPTEPQSSYRARSPEYGMNVFVWSYPDTTQRDLQKVKALGFTWQKALFQWRMIEGDRKGRFYWWEADRVVKASKDAGLKVIARLDFQPLWARADGSRNGPPDSYDDFGDFVYAVVDRYKEGGAHGQIDAIEVWNEPNYSVEWGGNEPNASEYVELLKTAYRAAKRANPGITVLSAGLAPTGWNKGVIPDDVFLQQMYDAGAKDYFDVLGAHAPGFKAPPSASPADAANNPSYGGNRAFTFRRIEDERSVMVRNGDADKQIWLTEFGWTSDPVHPEYSWFRVSEDQKAKYILDALNWAADYWSPWVGVMTLWNIPDPAWTGAREEYWWGITNSDGSNRQAYTTLKTARDDSVLP